MARAPMADTDDKTEPEEEAARAADVETEASPEAAESSEPEVELYREPGQVAHTTDDDRPRLMSRPKPKRLLLISGAKGGVGKTVVASNLALYLATIGRRVVLADADPVGSNAFTCLGVERPRRTLGLDEQGPADGKPELIDAAVPGLRLMHAGIDEPVRGQRRLTRHKTLMAQLREVDAEYMVVDLGSGIGRSLVDFWLASDMGVFVTVPEPTAIENTFRFVRIAFSRHLLARAPDAATRRSLVRRMRAMGHAPAPLDLARRLEAAGDPASEVVRDAMDAFTFRFSLNQTRLRADLELGEAIRSAARRRFGVNLEYLGYIDYDDTVLSCLRMQRPLLAESPGTKASRSIEKLARKLLTIEAGKARKPPATEVPFESHHDILEVDRGATDEEIRRAFKRMKEIYAPDSLCCQGLFDHADMGSLRARLEEAYDVLLDPARRRPYELSVFPPAPEPARSPLVDADSSPRPPAPVLTPDTEFTGALLRAVRESQGVEVRDIAQRTKIGTGYLQAIEGDDYASLPAPVYVRGFVSQMAKVLRLDSGQVSRTYVRRYERFIDEREKSL